MRSVHWNAFNSIPRTSFVVQHFVVSHANCPLGNKSCNLRLYRNLASSPAEHVQRNNSVIESHVEQLNSFRPLSPAIFPSLVHLRAMILCRSTSAIRKRIPAFHSENLIARKADNPNSRNYRRVIVEQRRPTSSPLFSRLWYPFYSCIPLSTLSPASWTPILLAFCFYTRSPQTPSRPFRDHGSSPFRTDERAQRAQMENGLINRSNYRSAPAN